MPVIFNYDEPVNQSLAVDGVHANLPVESRNFAREGLATVSGTIALDNSYPTGGYAVPANFGLKVLAGILFGQPPGYQLAYNPTTSKIQVYNQGAAAGPFAEVAAGTNLSAVTPVYFEAKGRQY